MVVRLLPSGAAINSTPDLVSGTYHPRPASHCKERYREHEGTAPSPEEGRKQMVPGRVK